MIELLYSEKCIVLFYAKFKCVKNNYVRFYQFYFKCCAKYNFYHFNCEKSV